MESSVITRVMIPFAIVFIMFGLGLSLTPGDFKRVWTQPVAMSLGIALQIIGLPVLGFVFVLVLGLGPVPAAAVMLLSACPGGAIANLVSFVSKGDVALSVSLTAVNSFITAVSLPAVVALSLRYFMGDEVASGVNVLKLSLGTITIIIPPMLIGMLTRKKAPVFARNSEKWVRKLTIIFLVMVASFASYQERQTILDNYRELTMVAVALCVLSAGMGCIAGSLIRLPRRQTLTIAIEVGLHNSAMGIVVAVSLLGMPALAVFPAFYLLVEYTLSGILMVVMNSPIGKSIMGVEYG